MTEKALLHNWINEKQRQHEDVSQYGSTQNTKIEVETSWNAISHEDTIQAMYTKAV